MAALVGAGVETDLGVAVGAGVAVTGIGVGVGVAVGAGVAVAGTGVGAGVAVGAGSSLGSQAVVMASITTMMINPADLMASPGIVLRLQLVTICDGLCLR